MILVTTIPGIIKINYPHKEPLLSQSANNTHKEPVNYISQSSTSLRPQHVNYELLDL
jgi:hypothetical protein